MTTCTAARRSAVIGLGLLGAVALSGTAQAQSAPVPQTPVSGVVDPLTTALSGAVDSAVAQAQPVVDQAPAPVPGTVKQLTAKPPAPAPTNDTPPTTTPGPGGTSDTPPGQQPANSQPPAQQAPAQQPAVADPTGGYGVASVPDSLVRKLNSLEQFSPGTGLATATDPMSLFGAPQVAPQPAVTAEMLPTPLAVRPAGNDLAQVLPIRAAQELPAALVAIAFATVAGAGAAQVAALSGRRQGGVPA